MNVIHASEAFNLVSLPSDWVEEIWRNNFSEESELPLDYLVNLIEDTKFDEELLVLIGAIQSWFYDRGASSSQEKSFRTLINLGLNYKALLCLLNVFIKSSYENQDSRILGLISTRVYINFLQLPEALAFNIYNFNIFQRVIKTLAIPKMCKQAGPLRNNKKPASNVADPDTVPALSAPEKMHILYESGRLLQDFPICIEVLFSCFSLEDPSLKELVQVLVDLTRLEPYLNVLTSTNIQRGSVSYVSRKAYDTLEHLCLEEQGTELDVSFIVVSCFLPTLILNEEDVKVMLVEKNELRKHTFSFFQKLVTIAQSRIDVGNSIVCLLQHLCLRLPEREELRSKAVPDIIKFMQILPQNLLNEIALWVVSLMHNETVKNRLSAAEVLSGLLNVAGKISDDSVFNNSQFTRTGDNLDHVVPEKKLMYKTLFASILSGICDGSATLRSKCLGIFSRLLLSSQLEIKSIVNEIFHSNRGLKSDAKLTSCIFDFHAFFEGNPTAFPSDPLPAGLSLIKVIEKLTSDEKVAVRKNALTALANIYLVNENFINSDVLKVLVKRCSDVYVSVRKQLAKSLTDLVLRYPSRSDLIEGWVDGVLRLIVDNETKSSEQICTLSKVILIDNINYHEKSTTPLFKLPWKVLKVIDSKEQRSLLSIVCGSWQQQGLIRPVLLKMLESHIHTENCAQVWLLYYSLSEHLTLKNCDFIYDYYIHNFYNRTEFNEYVAALVLEVLFLNWKGLSDENKENLFVRFKSAVENFKVPFPLIPRCLDYCCLYKKEATLNWSGALVKKCETLLRQLFTPAGLTGDLDESQLCRCIYTLGDASQFHPGVSPDILRFLAYAIDPQFSKKSSIECAVSGRAMALAITTLGKVCLQDNITAKTYVPLFGGLLTSPASPVTVKINTMTALSDICRRFTSVVEDYLGNMCITLKDHDVSVRRNSLYLIMALIQEDYLKIKSPLIYYVLMMLLDSSSEIRDMTDSFVINNILKKNNHVMSHYFIQSIFFFNAFEDAEHYVPEDISEMEKLVFSLSGVNNLSNRTKLYRYMLCHMGDMERFQMLNKLCSDILDPVTDRKIPLNAVGNAVVKDALYSISCKEMRLDNLQKQPSENDDVFDLIAKQSLLNTILKRNYMENIIPILRKLQILLVKIRSPLQPDIMKCFRALIKDYKEEMEEILEDPLLATELALDLRSSTESSDEEEGEASGGPQAEEPDPLGLNALKDLRVTCVRLTEDVLFRQYGIPVNRSTASPASSSLRTPRESFTSFLSDSAAGPSSVPASPAREGSKVFRGSPGPSGFSVIEASPPRTRKGRANSSLGSLLDSDAPTEVRPPSKRTARKRSYRARSSQVAEEPGPSSAVSPRAVPEPTPGTSRDSSDYFGVFPSPETPEGRLSPHHHLRPSAAHSPVTNHHFRLSGSPEIQLTPPLTPQKRHARAYSSLVSPESPASSLVPLRRQSANDVPSNNDLSSPRLRKKRGSKQ